MIYFGLNKLVKLFANDSVCVTGMRGSGKDVLFGNIIARRKKPYVSNLDYGGDREDLSIGALNLGGATYDQFINGNLPQWKYPYKIGSDIYISDVGVYMPSQYCNELNKKYSSLPLYFALSRQVSKNNIHLNVQNLNRSWDKLREQSNVYIRCRKCTFLGPIVILNITYYDKAESCQNRVQPCRVSVPFLASKEMRLQADIYKDNFFNSHGTVKNMTFVFFNKSNHDTYHFGKLLGVLNDDA